jgi:hypothetical protein
MFSKNACKAKGSNQNIFMDGKKLVAEKKKSGNLP